MADPTSSGQGAALPELGRGDVIVSGQDRLRYEGRGTLRGFLALTHLTDDGTEDLLRLDMPESQVGELLRTGRVVRRGLSEGGSL